MKESSFFDMTLIRLHSQGFKALGFALGSLVLIFAGVIPLFQSARSTQETLSQTQSQLDDVSERVVILSNLDETILSERVKVLDRVLPPSKDIVSYIVALDGLSRELGLSLGDVQLSPGEIGEGSKKEQQNRTSKLNSLETEVRVVGALESIYSFLRQIETMAPLMKVKDVAMVRVGTGDNFSLQLRLSMLYADPESSGSLTGIVSLFNSREEELYERLSTFKRYTLGDGVSQSALGKGDLFAPQEAIDQDQLSQPESSLPLPEEESQSEDPLLESESQSSPSGQTQ